MKKKVVLLFIVILLFGVSACKPTPTEPVVQSKNDGSLQGVIGGDAAPQGVYEAPETWVETITSTADETLVVNMDATIFIPEVEAYPVYRVFPEEITQEQADAFMQSFIGDSELQQIINGRTKAIIEEEIQSLMDEIDDPNSVFQEALKAGRITQEEYGYNMDFINGEIAALQDEYKTAPLEAITKDINRQFKSVQNAYAIPTMEIMGTTKESVGSKYINIVKEAEEPFVRFQEKYFSTIGQYALDITALIDKTQGLNDMSMQYEDALAIAEKAVHETMGYGNYQLTKACTRRYATPDSNGIRWYVQGKTNADLPEAYGFIYTPVIDGIPLLYYFVAENITGSNSRVLEMWTQKCVYVEVGNEGLRMVCERSSLGIGDKLNENATLLTFDKIQEIFKNYITLSPNYSGIPDTREAEELNGTAPYLKTINVTDIRLGYMRVVEKDNVHSGLLMPVWMFYGQQVDKYSEQIPGGWMLNENNEKVWDDYVGQSFLIINAIDGSIIDPILGY